MGSQPSKQQNGQASVSINHPRFREAKLVGSTKQKHLQISMGVGQKDYEAWKQKSKKISKNCQYLLVPLKQEFTKKGLCGDTGTLKLTFQNYSYLLTEQIYDRCGRRQKFQESQLWYLLLCLLEAQNQAFTQTNSKLGDIRPHNVFLNTDGRVKTTCLLSWPNQRSSYYKSAYQNEVTYLSPEQMVRIEMGTLQQSAANQSQVFSIGFTVLSAAMLQDFSQLYDLKKKKFNTNQASSLLQEWRANTVYSQIFTALISNLCRLEPQKRLVDKQLYSWLSKYKSFIDQKQDFCIQEAPLKIQRQIQQLRRQNQPQNYYQPPKMLAPNYQQNFVTPVSSYISDPSQGINSHIKNPSQLYYPPPPPGAVILRQSQLPPQIRQQLAMGSPRLTSQDFNSQGPILRRPLANGQYQMPPQLVGRVINQTYITPQGNSEVRTIQQGFIPPNNQRPSVKAGTMGVLGDNFQGRIEETMYIPRSNSAKKVV